MQRHDAGCLDEQVIATICEQLTVYGYCVVADFLPELVANALYLEASSDHRLSFKQAAIGREQLQQVNTQVRSDSIAWLNNQSETQGLYLKLMEHLRIEINRRLFLGLFDYESHFAHYGQGDFYKRHVDAFKGSSNRLLSSVVYLNADWVKADQGELLMFHDEQVSPFLIVEPIFNQCVIFLSEQFPHEVRTAKRDRYSIAGWFRTNNSIGGQIDPPR
ncbi:2OG-Fe(II) oxygenase [Paraglaciecola polaris]|uniref:SM-20-related protein n=1 Tax=Paraglaciecola polaris LMG 21857 TaxID=1129793 RepID=K6ZGL4_9ALTE|nr:2OG-Fe(II) oxygenase [Paraglaciecola polaris]GAC35161.1 SM-20-related protein [Paraglaciecola polaris LMG 21857]|tara:strand:- start:11255 stop:11908 length:654 start_codon:yes stop_codon:yes gene_type:complete